MAYGFVGINRILGLLAMSTCYVTCDFSCLFFNEREWIHANLDMKFYVLVLGVLAGVIYFLSYILSNDMTFMFCVNAKPNFFTKFQVLITHKVVPLLG